MSRCDSNWHYANYNNGILAEDLEGHCINKNRKEESQRLF
jgi:hypothetical protein